METYTGFNDEAGNVQTTADLLTKSAGQEFISSLDILRSILRYPKNHACRVLTQLGHTSESILPALETQANVKLETETSAMSWPKRIFDNALKILYGWGDAKLGTEHILMGLILEEDCVAAQKLNGLLITAERVKVIIFSLRAHPTPPAAAADAAQELREELANIQAGISSSAQSMMAFFEDANKALRNFIEKH